MNDSLTVRFSQGLGDLARDEQAVSDRQALTFKVFGKVYPVEPLHGQIGTPFGGEAMRDMRDDRRVADLGKQLDLAQKALSGLRVGAGGMKELKRHHRTGLLIVSSVYRAGTALPCQRLHPEPLPHHCSRPEYRPHRAHDTACVVASSPMQSPMGYSSPPSASYLCRDVCTSAMDGY